MSSVLNIQNLPTRWEALSSLLGDNALSTLLPIDDELAFLKRLVARMRSANQGKLQFLLAGAGAGKTSFVQSLSLFLGDQIARVHRVPKSYELAYADLPQYISQIKPLDGITVISFDGREALELAEAEHRNMLVDLNVLLRDRPDLLVVWPVVREEFALQVLSILDEIGGASATGSEPSHSFTGLDQTQFMAALSKLLAVANWTLDDAGIEEREAEELALRSQRMGTFLDKLQGLVAERFDLGDLGVDIPTLIFAVSSGNNQIRSVCRNLRRADSFYVEAARLTMYTKRSNVAEWWSNRRTESSLPHVVALFNAQLVAISPSAVVHSVANCAEDDLAALTSEVSSNRGAETNVLRSTELYKYLTGAGFDVARAGNPSDATLNAYTTIQTRSETDHKRLNRILIEALRERIDGVHVVGFEERLVSGLQTDVLLDIGDEVLAVELHHKAASESTENRIAIYLLEKLKEYTINFGIVDR